MPSVTYDGQSFILDGRRLWIVAAGVHYARLPHQLWASTIAAAKDAGFNAIQTSCPWLVHEPRPGRFVFEADADIRRFVQICQEQGLKVILHAGPSIGQGYDGGGLPAWLQDIPMPAVVPGTRSGAGAGLAVPFINLREASEPFLEKTSLYFRKLFAELSQLDASHGGPIIAVQAEHAWLCANSEQATRYLLEIARMIRENGMDVPITNSNDLWQDVSGTIDTWRGTDDLLVHLRQLRSVHPKAPRIVSEFQSSPPAVWGQPEHRAKRAAWALMHRMAQVLAAGANIVLSPFQTGMNFGMLGGRTAGPSGGFAATVPYPMAPLDETAHPVEAGSLPLVRRLATFASQFGSVFAELDSEHQPPVVDLNASVDSGSGDPSIVALRGGGGRIIFVFRSPGDDDADRPHTIVLEDGVRMPVLLGDQPVGWYLFDVDLGGAGRLEYTNLCAWALVDRSILVLYGPAGSQAYLSIAGNPLHATVPPAGSAKPIVLQVKSVTVVICNARQVDATRIDQHAVHVGCSGIDAEGHPLAAAGFAKVCTIRRDSNITMTPPVEVNHSRSSSKLPVLEGWTLATCEDFLAGRSPRFASLEGPSTLSACGAMGGYGWHRFQFKHPPKRGQVCWPQAGDRVHLYHGGRLLRVIGEGPGAADTLFDLGLKDGSQPLVALVHTLGRFSEGNDLNRRQGLHQHLYLVKPLRGAKPKLVKAEPADPFAVRGYIEHRAVGQLSDQSQVAWTFTHTTKSPIIIHIAKAMVSGTFVLNDKVVAYYAGQTGAGRDSIVLHPSAHKSFKRGKNELRFAPDLNQANAAAVMAKAAELFEGAVALTESCTWSFAKWEPPAASLYRAPEQAVVKALRGKPCWWRATFPAVSSATPLWLDLKTLSKGQVFLNGRSLGRYFTAAADGKPVGPQASIWLPHPWLKHTAAEINELVIFDEFGHDPRRAKIAREA